jgi:hypothetical protein
MRAQARRQARLLRNRGVFWGHNHFFLSSSWAGHLPARFAGRFLRNNFWTLSDGSWGRAYLPTRLRSRRFPARRLRLSSLIASKLSAYGVNPVLG